VEYYSHCFPLSYGFSNYSPFKWFVFFNIEDKDLAMNLPVPPRRYV
jgi:hypothetical protein